MFDDVFLPHLGGQSGRDSQVSARCPFHNDENPSFSVNLETGLWKCHAGCGEGDAERFSERIGSLDGLKRLPEQPPKRREVVAKYEYTDESEAPLFRVCRTNPKGFFQERFENGKWVKGLDGVQRVLYRLSEIRDASTVYIVEGEKDADRLWEFGIPATTCPGGAGKWKDEFSSALEGKNVAIIPDNDHPGEQHALNVAKSVHPVAASVTVVHLSGLGLRKEKHGEDVSDWLDAGHTRDELIELADRTSPLTPVDVAQSNEGGRDPWRKAKDAPSFIAEEDTEFDGLARDLLAPGAITLVAAPRGVGKTQVAHALAVALATGGEFRGEQVRSVSVLLVDRDNPTTVVKRRLRDWGACDAIKLKVLTRENAPDLKDRRAWESFPVEEYDALIIDSVGSATEGITEKEGKQTTEVLATLLDLARKNIAILLLTNTTKDAVNLKGRGEWADRVDILYEVRDATDLTPSGKRDWWQELPEAGESAWADRAARRRGRISLRLAFIPSKFRLGPEPDPFCVELQLPKDEPWTLSDVTSALLEGGEASIDEARNAQQAKKERAAEWLSELVRDRAADGKAIQKTEAVELVRTEKGITRDDARNLVEENIGSKWCEVPLPGKGGPTGLFPPDSDLQNDSAAKMHSSQEAYKQGVVDTPISAVPYQSGPQKSGPMKPLFHRASNDPPFSPPDFESNKLGALNEGESPTWEEEL